MLLFLAVAKTTRARKSHAHRLPDFLHHTPLQVPRAVATSFVAACGGRERRGGEDTSRSGRGLAAPCTPAFSLALPDVATALPTESFCLTEPKHNVIILLKFYTVGSYLSRGRFFQIDVPLQGRC